MPKDLLAEALKTDRITEQDLQDVIITAVEGGIGYWAQVDGYKWDCSPTETIDSLRIAESKDVDYYSDSHDPDHYKWDEPMTIDRERLKKAILYRSRHLGKTFRSYLDDAPDAGEADVLIQLTLLGEIRYG